MYPLHCYGDAIAKIPDDLRQYSSIVEDIVAARQRAVRTGQGVRLPAGHNSKTETQKASEPSGGLFKEAFNKIGPRNADSVPLPLLILGGLSLLLIAAGAAGVLSRRLRTRRVSGP